MAVRIELLESRLSPLRHGVKGMRENVLQLNLKMCGLKEIDFDYNWEHRRDDYDDNGTPAVIKIPRSDIIDQLSRVWKLDLSLNEIEELTFQPLRDIVNLRVFDVSLNKIKRVSGLENFQNLAVLNLSHNQLSGLSFLRSLYTLVELNLSMNEIKHLEDIPTMVSLTVLNLSDNKLRSLDGIQSLPYLKELHVQRNFIEQLTPLSSNRRLMYLNAAQNRIDHLQSTIHTLRSLTNLSTVVLLGNPLEQDKDYKDSIAAVTSIDSIDFISIRKHPGLLAFTMENHNPNENTANDLIGSLLSRKRDRMEENIRYLQNKIVQQKEEFSDYEAQLRATDPRTLHLISMAPDTQTNLPYRVEQPVTEDKGVPSSPMRRIILEEENEPSVSAGQQHPGIVATSPTQEFSSLKKPMISKATSPVPSPKEVMANGPNRNSKPKNTRVYKGLRDTDEILRLASSELSEESNHMLVSN